MKAIDRARKQWRLPLAANKPFRLAATLQEQGMCRAFPCSEGVRCRCGAGPWASIVDYERHERGWPPLPDAL